MVMEVPDDDFFLVEVHSTSANAGLCVDLANRFRNLAWLTSAQWNSVSSYNEGRNI